VEARKAEEAEAEREVVGASLEERAKRRF